MKHLEMVAKVMGREAGHVEKVIKQEMREDWRAEINELRATVTALRAEVAALRRKE